MTGLHPYDGGDFEDGSLATDVTGYPDDKGSRIFGMTGESEKVSSNQEGGQIIAYDIDATQGQSGSAVRIRDGPKEPWKVIGLHCGLQKDGMLNVGAVITPKMFLEFLLPEFMRRRAKFVQEKLL